MKRFIMIAILFGLNSLNAQNKTPKDSIKTTELQEVVIKSTKKAVEQKADRTIYNFSEQAYLNSGSLMEGLKKLPGLIISDVAGMVYQGKQLEVYMDGRPTNMYSDELNSYLESLPANSVEKVEIVTQPGAEFPATSGGAIINIITSKNAKKYISLTYSNGFGTSTYDKSRSRFNNSVLVTAKNNLLGWQLQVGQNYTEGYQKNKFTNENMLLSDTYSDKMNRFYFIKSGVKFDFKKDRLLLNYDVNTNNNNSVIDAYGYGFASNDQSKTKRFRNDVNLVYQKRFQNTAKKIDVSFNFNKNTNDFIFFSRNYNTLVLDNTSTQNFYQFKTDFSNEFKFLDKTKFSFGLLADQLDFTTKNREITNLDYNRNTFAAYTEFQSTYKSFDFILGARLESYEIQGNTDINKLTTFKQTRFFPNATIQYNIIKEVFINANYNKKISLPNTASLNPNNTNYQNQNVTFLGNPNLNPTLFNNFEFKISAMEYFSIGYSLSNANNQVINRVVGTSNGIASRSENVPKVAIHNYNFGLPIPFMLFTKGLKKTLQFDFNPDEIDFLYAYISHQKYVIDGIDSKGFWNFNLMMQLILPKKINFTTNYSTSTTGGNYYYYLVNTPLNKQFDATFSKKFLSNNLSISLYFNDIFNTNKQNFTALGTHFIYLNKYDSRRFGFSLNYKLPSKNKAAKEENILSNDKKEEKPLDK